MTTSTPLDTIDLDLAAELVAESHPELAVQLHNEIARRVAAAATRIVLTDVDRINSDGTITRFLCPTCEAPVKGRPCAPGGRGYICTASDAQPAPLTRCAVTYAPLVKRFAIPLEI